MTPSRSDEMVARQWSMARSTGSKVQIVYPKDYSSGAIQSVLDGADSDVLFLGDPLINIEPAARMLERMAVVMRDRARNSARTSG